MRAATLVKADKQLENDAFREWFYARLEALWQDSELQQRIINLPEEEKEKLRQWWLYCFTAEIAVKNNATREELVDAMGEAFDTVAKEYEAEEEDVLQAEPESKK